MLAVERTRSGDYSLSMPFPVLLSLQELPEFLNQVLTSPTKSKLLERLFPPAYEDSECEAEYRGLLAEDLVSSKREAMSAYENVLEASEIDLPNAVLTIPSESFDLFLSFINDVRVLLGIELDITQEGWGETMPSEHPEGEKLLLLHLLTYLEQQLLEATGLVEFEEDFDPELGPESNSFDETEWE